MRADDHSEHYDAEGRPTMRRHSLCRVTCDWAIEHGLQDHPLALAAAVAATNVQSRKLSASQKAALLAEWRRCMEALGSTLVEEDPLVAHVKTLVSEGCRGRAEWGAAQVSLFELVLRPGSPWRP